MIVGRGGSVEVGVTVGVAVAVAVGVSVGMAVGVSVGRGVGVSVGVEVAVAVGVAVGTAVAGMAVGRGGSGVAVGGIAVGWFGSTTRLTASRKIQFGGRGLSCTTLTKIVIVEERATADTSMLGQSDLAGRQLRTEPFPRKVGPQTIVEALGSVPPVGSIPRPLSKYCPDPPRPTQLLPGKPLQAAGRPPVRKPQPRTCRRQTTSSGSGRPSRCRCFEQNPTRRIAQTQSSLGAAGAAGCRRRCRNRNRG